MLGNLAKYKKGYTLCQDSCDFNNTDKTQRLGYDNTTCLLKCNDFFSNLRKKNLPDINVQSLSEFCFDKDIKKQEQCYQYNLCKQYCQLDSSLMKPDQLTKCFQNCYNIYYKQ